MDGEAKKGGEEVCISRSREVGDDQQLWVSNVAAPMLKSCIHNDTKGMSFLGLEKVMALIMI